MQIFYLHGDLRRIRRYESRKSIGANVSMIEPIAIGLHKATQAYVSEVPTLPVFDFGSFLRTFRISMILLLRMNNGPMERG
jgi:hypothetical protein